MSVNISTMRGTLSQRGNLSGSISGQHNMSGSLSVPNMSSTSDYETLINKPSINGVELSGNKTAGDLYLVSENTTAGWNSNPQYCPKSGEICIYTDYKTVIDDMGNEITFKGIKIGDGNAYLIDMPFVGDDIRYFVLQKINEHESNHEIHITKQERNFWNNKLNYDIDGEELILNRE